MAPHLGPIYMLNQNYALAEREGGIAQAERHDGVWRASRFQCFTTDAIPDAYSRPDYTHFSGREDALLHSTLLTTAESPAAYLTTLAEAIHQVSCIAAHWDWRVVAAAVGAEEAAAIAAVALNRPGFAGDSVS